MFGLQPPAVGRISSHPSHGRNDGCRLRHLKFGELQPRGPYFLAGHSFGGLVSFEIAQQLVRAGESVSFLGLIDTTLVNPSSELSSGFALVACVLVTVSLRFFEKLNWISEIALAAVVCLEAEFGTAHSLRSPD